MVISQLPELIADTSDQKGILSDNGRRELVVDQVRQNSRRSFAATKGDGASPGDTLAGFDDNAARALGIKRLQSVADGVRAST
jgi:hypothetical protein